MTYLFLIQFLIAAASTAAEIFLIVRIDKAKVKGKAMLDEILAKAANVVGFFEGFVATSFWDVNHYRVGYGSSTHAVLTPTGYEYFETTETTRTTMELAKVDLAHRLESFEQTIIAQITATRFDALGENSKIALLSFAYNYGSLTETLARVLKEGAPHSEIVAAVAARAVDNNYLNRPRRIAEAALIASDG